MSKPSSAEAVVRDFMATFTEVWPMRDATALRRFFSEGCEYRNGPAEPVTGAKPSSPTSPQ